MEKERSTMWVWAAVLVLVVAGVLFMVLNKKDDMNTVPEENTSVIVDDSTTVKDEPKESAQDTTGATTGVPAVSISYANALKQYADRRIQLDKMCQAVPNTVTYKDNTGVMIDNRSPQTRTVKVDQVYTIKPYGFRIVVLPDTYLKSKTVLVDCDKSQNVATILVQE